MKANWHKVELTSFYRAAHGSSDLLPGFLALSRTKPTIYSWHTSYRNWLWSPNDRKTTPLASVVVPATSKLRLWCECPSDSWPTKATSLSNLKAIWHQKSHQKLSDFNNLPSLKLLKLNSMTNSFKSYLKSVYWTEWTFWWTKSWNSSTLTGTATSLSRKLVKPWFRTTESL